MRILLCISLFLITAFAQQLGCFINESNQSIVFIKDGQIKNLDLKDTIYKNQECGNDGESFYIANLNNEIIEVTNEKNFYLLCQMLAVKSHKLWQLKIKFT